MTSQKMPDATPPALPPDDTSKLLANADKLIQRRRVFIASPSSATQSAAPAHFFEAAEGSPLETIPTFTAHPLAEHDADHDLPLLTEKVTSPTPSLADIQALQRDAVQKELASWLEQELPLAILKITDGVADQLLGELTRNAEQHLLPTLMAQLSDHQRDHRRDHRSDLPPDTPDV